MINYKKLTKDKAKEFVTQYDKMPDGVFNDAVAQWKQFEVDHFDESYKELRNEILQTFQKYKDGDAYELDIQIGLKIYAMLNEDVGFTNVKANDDDIWRYLECMVFPDITHFRYPPQKKEIEEGHKLNHKRFYSHSRRIWLKSLWWYIHLSWQGSEKATYKVLKDLGTDTISDLTERPGKGFRLKLYRALMKEYSHEKNKNSDLFNKIQKKNLVNCRTLEPALSEDGEAGYVKRLLEQVKI